MWSDGEQLFDFSFWLELRVTWTNLIWICNNQDNFPISYYSSQIFSNQILCGEISFRAGNIWHFLFKQPIKISPFDVDVKEIEITL